MAKFKKVETNPVTTSFEPMDNEQVEDEIMAAAEEGRQRIAELEAENAALLAGKESLVKTAMERLDMIEELKAELAKYKPKPLPEVTRKTRRFVNEVRQQDTPKINRTCACCTKRCSIPKEISEHEDFCIKCLGR
jgi:hypothetical protein